ncbi:MAG: hypothetical protein H0V66_15190 [Bdellovibrionales bacterium]|nr:hypothetical protein [Bdellovibrionales bacterium]
METQNFGSEIILNILAGKRAVNSLYSLKALGRDLKISQPQLTKIIKGDRRLTPQIAAKIGQHMKMGDAELLKFILSTMLKENAKKTESL